MKRLFVFGVLTSLFLSCGQKKEEKKMGGSSNSGPLTVESIAVKASSLSENIEVAGNILPFELTEIRPEITGRIVQINFKEGGFQEKNALLVKLFDGDLQAQLKKLQVQLEIATKTEDRQRELLKISGISQQDYDLSLLQVNNIKADIELTEVNISKTEIRAPYAGRMGLRYISPGAYVTPSNILTTISQVNQKKISFSIPEKYSTEIKTGMSVTFTVEGRIESFNAIVLATETSIEPETRNLKVIATINDAGNKLTAGSFAKVTLNIGKKNAALIIPTAAIIPSARSKQVILYKDGTPLFVNVTTGVRTVDNVEITSGINQGDTVVTTGLLFIRKESKLKLSKVD
jgi:membrane fusion protein (multidrug efflux system)